MPKFQNDKLKKKNQLQSKLFLLSHRSGYSIQINYLQKNILTWIHQFFKM